MKIFLARFLLLCSVSPALVQAKWKYGLQSSYCYYLDYPATAPGNDLTGPTHTCTCSSSGSGHWTNCRPITASRTTNAETQGQTIVDIAVGNDAFTTLVTAVQAAGLGEALSSTGPFTVFAPTNEAFAALPDGALDTLLGDKDALTEVLLYHVVEGKVLAGDLPDFLSSGTLLDGQQIELVSDSSGVTVNGANVITADVEASNGVIHVIDEVLIPEGVLPSAASDTASNTIVDIAVANADFTTLVTAVQAAGLGEALSSTGPFTVFAPTNEAFAALPDGALDTLLGDKDALTEVLLYHVVEGKVLAGDIPDFLSSGTLLDGQQIELVSDSSGVTVNGANVIAADVEASNGVIHVIDEVLIPDGVLNSDTASNTIVDIAVATDATSTLVQAVLAADPAVIETLSGPGPYTVFAPTNDAFAALPDDVLNELLADPDSLTKILLYHVVPGKVESKDIPKYFEAETLLEQEMVLERGYGNSWWCNWFDFVSCSETVTINEDASVVIPDVFADNGIIHVIDEVLIPKL